MAELIDKLNEKGIEFKTQDLQKELKKYCTVRGSKYYLKIVKE